MEDPGQLPEKILSDINMLLQDLKLKKKAINFSKGSAKGQNYLGIITKVKVSYEDVEDKPGILNLVIKSAPQAKEFREYIKFEIIHKREIFMYESVFPELIKLQEKNGLEIIFNPFAKCYKTSCIPPFEHLIFEDMNAHGYILKNRKNVLDLNHCLEVLKSYGQYHGLALALKVKEPEIYFKLLEGTKESYFNNVSLDDLCVTLQGPINKIIKNLNEVKDKNLIDKLKSFLKYPLNGLVKNLSVDAAQGQAVFCHGDCWNNNMLFKYKKDTDSTPQAVCFLDWQLSRCASPAVDIAYFIFACTDQKLRTDHYQQLLSTYHSSLSLILEKLNVDPEIFPQRDFLDHMKNCSKYGLMMCLITVPLFSAESDEIPDWTEDMAEGEREKMFTMERKSEKYIVKKLTDIVRDFDQFGYL